MKKRETQSNEVSKSEDKDKSVGMDLTVCVHWCVSKIVMSHLSCFTKLEKYDELIQHF